MEFTNAFLFLDIRFWAVVVIDTKSIMTKSMCFFILNFCFKIYEV